MLAAKSGSCFVVVEIKIAWAWAWAWGGLTLYKNAHSVQWPDLPLEVRLGLLMGNRLPCFTYTFAEPALASDWLGRFLTATQRPISTLLKERKSLVQVRFPDSPMFPSTQTSACSSQPPSHLDAPSWTDKGSSVAKDAQLFYSCFIYIYVVLIAYISVCIYIKNRYSWFYVYVVLIGYISGCIYINNMCSWLVSVAMYIVNLLS